MNERNRELLSKVIEKNLETTLSDEENEDVKKVAFDEAMKATDKQIEIDKIDASNNEAKKARWVQIGTFGVGLAIGTVADFLIKNYFIDKVGRIEQFETYTSTPGKNIVNSVFKFGKKN